MPLRSSTEDMRSANKKRSKPKRIGTNSANRYTNIGTILKRILLTGEYINKRKYSRRIHIHNGKDNLRTYCNNNRDTSERGDKKIKE